jgi:amino acid transporter
MLIFNLNRFAYAILAADELVAISNTLAFKYDDGRTFLDWKVGGSVDAAVWISLFLVIVVCINMLPVKVCSYSLSFLRSFHGLMCV